MLLIPDPLHERLVANFRAGPRHDPVPARPGATRPRTGMRMPEGENP